MVVRYVKPKRLFSAFLTWHFLEVCYQKLCAWMGRRRAGVRNRLRGTEEEKADPPMSWELSTDFAGDPSATQTERNSWRFLSSVVQVSQIWIFFISHNAAGLLTLLLLTSTCLSGSSAGWKLFKIQLFIVAPLCVTLVMTNAGRVSVKSVRDCVCVWEQRQPDTVCDV